MMLWDLQWNYFQEHHRYTLYQVRVYPLRATRTLLLPHGAVLQ